MPRRGGPAAIAGDEYQAAVVARYLLGLLEGSIDKVRPQAPPQADFGSERLVPVTVDDILVVTGDEVEFIEVKSQAPDGGQWTPLKLKSQQVLQKFYDQHTTSQAARCRLISGSPCRLFDEIARRAREAVSVWEFEANLTKQDSNLLLSTANSLGHPAPACLWQFLCSCHFELLPETSLTRELELRSDQDFLLGRRAVPTLLDVARAATGRLLMRESLLDLLRERSLDLKPTTPEQVLAEAVFSASSQLRQVSSTVADVEVPRDAVDQALSWIRSGEHREKPLAVFLDQAGSGKSAALAMLLRKLEAEGITVLGIRLDRIPFTTKEELSLFLELPESIPDVLASLVATGHRVAFLVDQLDAVSIAAGRDQRAMDVILDVIARVAATGSVPIVLACRTFDWEFDHRLHRLSSLEAKRLTLPDFQDHELQQVLDTIELATSRLSSATLAAVRSPLCLLLFVEMVKARREHEPEWSVEESPAWTLQRLHGELLDRKSRKAREDGLAPGALDVALGKVVEAMQGQQSLEVTIGRLEVDRRVVEWLCSEALLEQQDGRVSFRHQTLLDFVFARQFVAGSQSLVDHLLRTDQGLFFRPMVRQVLDYLRTSDARRFTKEYEALLEEPRIRRHLKSLAVAWLGHVPDPTDLDLRLMRPLLQGSADDRAEALTAILGNGGWLDRLGVVRLERWLREWPDPEVDRVVHMLSSMLAVRQEAVIGLLEPFAGQSLQWDMRIVYALARLQRDWTSRAGELFRSVVADVQLPLDEHGYWSHVLHNLAIDSPVLALLAIKQILDRASGPLSDLASNPNWASDAGYLAGRQRAILLPAVWEFGDALARVAEREPAAFIAATVTWLIRFLEATSFPNEPDHFRSSWLLWESDHDLAGPSEARLLAAVHDAVGAIARSDPPHFRALVSSLSGRGLKALQRMVAAALAVDPEEYQEDTARFLLADPRNLRLGPSHRRDTSAVALIVASAPHWSDADHQAVELAILVSSERPPRDTDDLRARGKAMRELLCSLDQGRLSLAARAELDRLERKFLGVRPIEPLEFEDGFVRIDCPIPRDAFSRMDDSAWVGAMRSYDGRPKPRDERKPLTLSRGALELSRTLEQEAKSDPGRFLAIALERMDSTLLSCYLTAIVSGLAQGGVELSQLEAVILRLLPGVQAHGIREVCWAIKRCAGQNLPQPLSELLLTFTFDRDRLSPTVEDCNHVTEGGESRHRSYEAGINSDRGAALDTLAMMMLSLKVPRAQEFILLASQIAEDPSPAVRAVAIEYLQYVVKHDPPRVVPLLARLVGDDRDLLRDGGAYGVVRATLMLSCEDVVWAIEAMLEDAESAATREHGAILACLAAHYVAACNDLRERALHLDSASRKGAARYFARNAASPKVREECCRYLQPLFNDEEEAVREHASHFFEFVEEDEVLSMASLVRAWATSRSVGDQAVFAARFLEKYPCEDMELTLDVAAAIVGAVGRSACDIRLRQAVVPSSLVPAILAVCQRSSDPSVRNRCMDLFEAAEDLGWPDVSKVFQAADRS